LGIKVRFSDFLLIFFFLILRLSCSNLLDAFCHNKLTISDVAVAALDRSLLIVLTNGARDHEKVAVNAIRALSSIMRIATIYQTSFPPLEMLQPKITEVLIDVLRGKSSVKVSEKRRKPTNDDLLSIFYNR
jgi:hypothetical protein